MPAGWSEPDPGTSRGAKRGPWREGPSPLPGQCTWRRGALALDGRVHTHAGQARMAAPRGTRGTRRTPTQGTGGIGGARLPPPPPLGTHVRQASTAMARAADPSPSLTNPGTAAHWPVLIPGVLLPPSPSPARPRPPSARPAARWPCVALWAPPLAVCVAPSVPYASIAADYAYLTAGVDQVSATPNCDASMMVLLGDSFPLVQAAPDAFSTDNHPYIRCKTAPKTFAAAGRYGSGKVVVFGHEAMLVDVIGDPDNGRPRKAGVFEGNAVLLINALRWLLAAVPPTRRPVIVGMHPLQEDIEPGRVRAAVELLVSGSMHMVRRVWQGFVSCGWSKLSCRYWLCIRGSVACRRVWPGPCPGCGPGMARRGHVRDWGRE